MATFFNAAHLAFLFGLLGNFFSCLVYLAPTFTFYRIYRRRSTENYQAIPYSVALFSAMLMLYYAYLNGNAFMLVTINSIGCGVEIAYLVIFFIFANRNTRIQTAQLFLLFNTAAYFLLVLLTHMVSPAPHRLTVVGWICAAFSVCVYAAPLSIMRLVIKTKSVEYMPFPLSLCLTLCAIVWFFYGFFIRDYFVASPNILGFMFGVAQIILYMIYRNGPRSEEEEEASEMQNVARLANERLGHHQYFYVVAEDMIEFGENMRDQRTEKDSNSVVEDEREAPAEAPKAGDMENAITPQGIRVDEIVEIGETSVPENTAIRQVG